MGYAIKLSNDKGDFRILFIVHNIGMYHDYFERTGDTIFDLYHNRCFSKDTEKRFYRQVKEGRINNLFAPLPEAKIVYYSITRGRCIDRFGNPVTCTLVKQSDVMWEIKRCSSSSLIKERKKQEAKKEQWREKHLGTHKIMYKETKVERLRRMSRNKGKLRR